VHVVAGAYPVAVVDEPTHHDDQGALWIKQPVANSVAGTCSNLTSPAVGCRRILVQAATPSSMFLTLFLGVQNVC
jgi:hypothetical protein